MERIHVLSHFTGFILFFLTTSWIVCADGFLTGAPDRSCKDPSTFHTRKMNASHEGIIMPRSMKTNPYMLDVDAVTFGPGSHVTVTISGGNSGIPMRGFFIQAVQANVDIRDLRRQAFGTFRNTTSAERPAMCQPVNHVGRGGITHTTNETKSSASAVWVAPSTADPGNIQFLATGVFDYDTYWTDIRSPVLTSAGYDTSDAEGGAPQTGATPTATWYRWLQYIRQQQLLHRLTYQQAKQRKPDPRQHKPGHKAGSKDENPGNTSDEKPSILTNVPNSNHKADSKDGKPMNTMDILKKPTISTNVPKSNHKADTIDGNPVNASDILNKPVISTKVPSSKHNADHEHEKQVNKNDGKPSISAKVPKSNQNVNTKIENPVNIRNRKPIKVASEPSSNRNGKQTPETNPLTREQPRTSTVTAPTGSRRSTEKETARTLQSATASIVEISTNTPRTSTVEISTDASTISALPASTSKSIPPAATGAP